jgi:type II secretory pathway component GspD/PulD (secretin)
MTCVRRVRVVAAVALSALLAAGCAAKWAYRQGGEAADRGEWDLAVARYTRALEKDPRNIRYKISLENARIQASRFHYDEARKHLAASELDKAADELEIASKYDPANRSAADDLLIVQERIRKRDQEQRERAEFDQMKARAQATRVPVPVLSPRSPVPITLNFQDASLEKIFNSLGKIAGVNILFDEGFRDKPKTSVSLTGVTFQEALDQLTFVNRLFYKVLDQNTLIIVPESRQKRLAYDDQVMRTFYLQNAEINDTVNLVKSLAKVQTVAGNPSLGAITVMGTLDQLAMAERIIDANDKARGEVLVEVQILEVDRNNAKEWGLDLSNYAAKLTFSPTGANGEITNDNFTNIRAHLLSSLNQADWIVSVPSTIFARFIQTESNVRILASPRLRAAEGKKAELKIGTEVPIPITTFAAGSAAGAGGFQSYIPATSFQYKNVGVTLGITPRVSASGDIALELAAEFSLLGDDRNVGTAGNPLNVPTFLTRNVTGVLRLRDGETGLIGGLIQSREARSFSGAIGIKDIPIIGGLFGDHKKGKDEGEVLISITPRIVRAPKVTEADLVPLRVGTQEVPKVEGARPGLFGPEPPPAGEGGGAIPPSTTPRTGPGAPGPPVSATPPPANAPSAPAAAPAAPVTPESRVAPPAPTATTPGGAPVAAADAARPMTVLFSPPEVPLRVGQAGGLAVVVVGAREVQSVELTLAWDPSLVEVTDVASGSLLTLDGSPVASERALETGRARVRLNRGAPASGSGAVVAITVRGLKPGSGTLMVESLTLGRAGGVEHPIPPPPARLQVAP